MQKVSSLALVSSFNKGMSEKVLLKNPYMLKSIYKCGGQNLSFCVGLKAPFTNNNVSEEEKVLEKAP